MSDITRIESGNVTVLPGDASIGAEIRGVDLSRPVDAETFAAIHDAFLAHSVIYFRGQDLAPKTLIAFSRRFGAFDVDRLVEHTLPGRPEVRVLSNVTKDGVSNADQRRPAVLSAVTRQL